MYTKDQAEKIRCPYVDKKCVTDGCMAWEWLSKFGDIAYENALTLKETRKQELLDKGYVELPSHGLGLALKSFHPMTEEEKTKLAGNTFGTQLFFGLETLDKSKWIGACSCVGIKDPS